MKTIFQYIISTILLLILNVETQAQYRVSTDNYTIKNGMPQNSVLGIQKDNYGFVWIATKNGLSRFDGYNFSNIKIDTKHFECSISNCFVQIEHDKKNRFWLLNNLGQVFCFDIKTNKFTLFPNYENNKGDNFISIKKIELLNNGDILLKGFDNGYIYISNQEYENNTYCAENHISSSSCKIDNLIINNIYESNDNNLWLLSNHGIAYHNAADSTPVFLNGESGNIFDCIEVDNRLIFSCNNGKIITYEKNKKRLSDINTCSKDNLIYIFCLDNDFVVCSETGDLILIDKSLKNSRVLCNVQYGIQYAWQDKKQDLWIKNNNNCLYRLSNSSRMLDKLPFSIDDEICKYKNKYDFSYSFIDDEEKIWFIPSDDNNNWYNLDKNNQKPVFWKRGGTPTIELEYTIKDENSVHWSSKKDNGLRKSILHNTNFKLIQCDEYATNAENNDVSAILEDSNNNIWIATKDNRLRIYDKKLNLICFVADNGASSNSRCFFRRTDVIFQDREGDIWCGGNSTLTQLKNLGNNKFACNTYKIDVPIGTKITDITEDSKNRIWVATDGDGLQLLSQKNNTYQFINRHNGFKNSYPPSVLKVNCIYEDTKGNIWTGSSEGITVFSSDFDDINYLRFFFYNPENSDMNTCGVNDIYQDSYGQIWLISFGEGLSKISTNFELGEVPEVTNFSLSNNEDENLTISVLEDKKRNMWVATENSILKISQDKKNVSSFGSVNGLNHMGFSKNAFALTHEDKILVGTKSGFYLLDLNNIKKENFCPKIVFTKMTMANKKVFSNNDYDINTTINWTDNITLNNKQNSFSIEFSALDYRDEEQIKYSYILEGFDENWNYIGNSRVATYTNLPPGEYTFIVKSTNSEGIWCDNERKISIKITPSFSQTIWAKLLLTLIILFVISIIVYHYISYYKMKENVRIEHDLSDMKLQFFTDVSHELRTPLTLINAPIENLIEKNDLSEDDKKQLDVAHQNTDRVLRILDQILDFRKIQSNKMTLKVEKTLIGDFIKKSCSNFDKLAENRRINFTVTDNTNNSCFWIDKNKMDTVIFNLLSNAFKFTATGKNISVSVNIVDEQCVISVKDQGCGIEKSKLDTIFERFVTLKDKSLTNQSGTGIGLALVKEIIELHKGQIKTESKIDEGSIFSVFIKPGTSHFDNNTELEIEDKSLPEDNYGDAESNEESDITKILIVEDNNDLRKFICSTLSKHYNVIEAENGKEGLIQAQKHNPDFIITDIMMPVMDGIELIRTIKIDKTTSHIPVILLTAKTDLQSKLDCLKIGATDYISKPFSMKYLEARIENILSERKKWQDEYRNKIFDNTTKHLSNTDADTCSSGPDDEFIKQVVDFINQNISNGGISPDKIADKVQMNRKNFSSKIKSLVGMTPIEFINEIRINKAAQLIKDTKLNMSEIAYEIGMNDSRYFSRCFKQKFGMTPSEYKSQFTDNNGTL